MDSVIVLGGGYGGFKAAKALDDVADVTLIDPTDAFMHNVAAWRALVEPSWLERMNSWWSRSPRTSSVAR